MKAHAKRTDVGRAGRRFRDWLASTRPVLHMSTRQFAFSIELCQQGSTVG